MNVEFPTELYAGSLPGRKDAYAFMEDSIVLNGANMSPNAPVGIFMFHVGGEYALKCHRLKIPSNDIPGYAFAYGV